MDKELSTMSSLLKTDKCSPLIVYIVLVIVNAVTIFNTNGILKKFQNFKVDNIFTMHLWHEIGLLLVLGVVLFGLCQYNQQTLAWIVLFFPLVFQIFKSLLVFNSVHAVQKLAPPDAPTQIPSVPDPTKGPAPPQIQQTAPTDVQSSGVRHAITERSSALAPPLNSQSGGVPSGFGEGIGGSPY
tara:strand:- start:790 stop:1341 length:552 start_codon:yes stop_codon:yes gene_type:complete